MFRAIFAGIMIGIGIFLAPFFIVPFFLFMFLGAMAFRRKMQRFRNYQNAMWQPYYNYPKTIQVVNENDFLSAQNNNRKIEIF